MDIFIVSYDYWLVSMEPLPEELVDAWDMFDKDPADWYWRHFQG